MTHSKKRKKTVAEENMNKYLNQRAKWMSEFVLCAGPNRIKQLEESLKEHAKNQNK